MASIAPPDPVMLHIAIPPNLWEKEALTLQNLVDISPFALKASNILNDFWSFSEKALEYEMKCRMTLGLVYLEVPFVIESK
jgi:hypothetical protein